MILLAKHSAFAVLGGHPSDKLIRETAFIVEAYLEAERVGEPRNPKLGQAAGYLLNDFQRLFATGGYKLHQPFFDGLAAEALIDYYEVTHDSRVPPAIKLMVDGLWDKGYSPEFVVDVQYRPEGSRLLGKLPEVCSGSDQSRCARVRLVLAV